MSEGLKHICFDLDDTLYEQIAPLRQALLTIPSVSNEQIRRIYKAFASVAMNCFFGIRIKRYLLKPCRLDAFSLH